MRNVRDYAIVTAAYWAFTLTDGALRMLVLFHLHRLGYAPLQVVSLFLFYEFFGVVTNFVGGWIGARFGLKSTLFVGLGLQVLACALLAWQADALPLALVLVAQAISGVAKDLTKMSAKSFIKIVVPAADTSGLLKWVAILTGSKNALKGVGFFLGAALLGLVGFRAATAGMAVALLLVALLAALALPATAGRAKVRPGFREGLPKDRRILWLSTARLFLFASRDVWFVFALPIFLSADLGWTFAQSGAFLALWVIGYGAVQAAAPLFLGGRGRVATEVGAGRVAVWTGLLLAPLGATTVLLWLGISPVAPLVGGLVLYGVVFATNSAMHSFLIVHYAHGDKVSQHVGFYYMANAAGRLLGTLLSGAVFQWAGMGRSGLVACLVAAMLLVVLAALACAPLGRAEAPHPESAA